jgi:phage tail sheath gpL-like
MSDPIGQVFELSASDKLPGPYLQTKFGIGGGGTSIRTLLLIGACASGGGTLTPDTMIADAIDESDAIALTGGTGNELHRMVVMVRRWFPATKIKLATVTQSTNTAATATITIGGTWTAGSTGPIRYRLGGCPIEAFVLETDDETTFGDTLEAVINGTANCPFTAVNTAGAVVLTAKSYGTRGNDLIVWQDLTYKPSGFTSTITGGSSVASGGKRCTSGAATENMSTLLDTLTSSGEAFWTIADAIIDATNLGRLETWLDAQCGPLVRRFGNVVVAATKTLAASTSLAQTTLDNVRFGFGDYEEGETPAEEVAAWLAGLRHQREQTNPNQKYGDVPTPFVPQEAASKRMSRARQVAALDVGLTPFPTRNGVVVMPRAITTRSLTATGEVDTGTIDVAAARVPDVINEGIGSLWQAYTDSEDSTAHHYLRSDPAPGEEADVPAGVTYPKDWQQQVTLYMKARERDKWITGVDTHPTVVGMHPTTATPRFVQYTPVIVLPHTYQLEGTIAQTKFVAS